MNDKDRDAIDHVASVSKNPHAAMIVKWPTQLVERIAAIDINAAQWIVDHWGELLEDKYTSDSLCGPNRYSRDACALNEMFNFEQTGNKCYWINISEKLGE